MEEYYYEYFPGFYPDDFFYEMPEVATSILDGFTQFFLAFMFIASIVSVVAYLFNSIGIYRIAKNRGMDNAFFAFIPYLNCYYFGKIADDIENSMNRQTDYSIKLTVLNVITSLIVGAIVPFLFIFITFEMYVLAVFAVLALIAGVVTSVCYSIYYYIALFKIYKEYSPSNAILFEILSIALSITPFLIYAVSNNKSGYQLWQEQQELEKYKAAHPEQFSNSFTGMSAQPVADTRPQEQTELENLNMPEIDKINSEDEQE